MIQILYAADHQDRGLALASAIGAQSALVTATPAAKPSLDTLTFWGHGDIMRLCNLLVADFVTLVSAWKKCNPSLKTVEIITCNARHAPGGYDSYAKQAATAIRKKHSHMVVKAMPMNMGGPVNAFSILLAHAPNASWCYITAPGPDDKTMFHGSNLVKAEANLNGYDLAQAANKVAIREKERKFSLNFGYFIRLRDQLVVVK